MHTPLQESERSQLLDSLRGFALLGIVVVNMMGFKSPFLAYSLTDSRFPGLANSVAQDAILFFASGKFVSIFSLLFGLGLVMQQQRAISAGRPFAPFIHRRMAVLLVIGIIHGIFLWAGDILALYAIFGFLSPALLRLRARTIIRLIGALALLFLALQVRAASDLAIRPQDFAPAASYTADWIDAYHQGDFPYLVQLRFQEWTYLWQDGFRGNHPYSFLFFLSGIALGKADVLSRLADWRKRMVILAKILLPLALALNLLALAHFSGWIRPVPIASFLANASFLLGDALMSFVYLVGFVSFHQSGRAPALHSSLACVGRLSLSNYLFQSLFANALFMYWGLGLFGKVPAHHGLLLSVLIFILQIFLSRFWLRHFTQGPAEWLWRKLSYPGAGG